MEPVLVGYGAHSSWIFDIVWLDNEHVCSGNSRANKRFHDKSRAVQFDSDYEFSRIFETILSRDRILSKIIRSALLHLNVWGFIKIYM